ncbi:HK97 gp10 family phage protein [Thalassotalea sp. G20_0]|uniref:HK97 gp10 family phage protein n=1 Tax=Thalassotalea sp. G20_0 TaxID=2821093 RepID=UPI001ADB3E8B|nr:HK97 gp10 family phage protein [Thalassotalea sp. G20_0]MBO9493854.1 HK97 gp10 family phage protein [Thalassotalea sp. G20_0]
MLKLDITLDDDQLQKAVQKAPGALRHRLKAAVSRGAAELSRDARGFAPKAFTTLTNSIRSRVDGELSRIVGPNVDYGVYVENGAGPGGAPSLQSVLDWVRVKRITPNNPQHDEQDLAFMIRRSIARKGTEPQKYMEPAVDAKRDRITGLMHSAVSNALKESGFV